MFHKDETVCFDGALHSKEILSCLLLRCEAEEQGNYGGGKEKRNKTLKFMLRVLSNTICFPCSVNQPFSLLLTLGSLHIVAAH